MFKRSTVGLITVAGMLGLASGAVSADSVSFDHTVSDFAVSQYAYCTEDAVGSVRSLVRDTDPDTGFIQSGDSVSATFTFDPPLVVRPDATSLSTAVRLDSTRRELSGGYPFTAGPLTLTGENLVGSAAPTATGASEWITPEDIVVGVAASGPVSSFLIDPSSDGVIESVAVSFTVPGGLPGYGDIAGVVESHVRVSASGECTGVSPPLEKSPDADDAHEQIECPIGTYQDDSGAVSCKDAPLDTYVDHVGAVAPTPCPANTHTEATGSTSVADCIPDDIDSDGVPDVGDACPATLLPDAPTLGVKKNRYAADANGVFGDSGYTLADTAGCSGGQIIDRAALGKGHTKFGITRGALEDWIAAL